MTETLDEFRYDGAALDLLATRLFLKAAFVFAAFAAFDFHFGDTY